MWSKYGSSEQVLAQINKVIPSNIIHKRFVVVDAYADLKLDAGRLFREYGWQIALNQGVGLAGAANTALSYVTTEYFASFEDDVVLSVDWWSAVNASLSEGVAVVQGVRYTNNRFIRVLEELQEKRKINSCMDNNLCLTKAFRQVGGYPAECKVCVDANLKAKIERHGYKWIITFATVSTHLRSGFTGYLKDQRKWWIDCSHKGEACFRINVWGDLKRFLYSPIRGLQVAWQKRIWELFFLYPVLRGCMLYYSLRYGVFG